VKCGTDSCVPSRHSLSRPRLGGHPKTGLAAPIKSPDEPRLGTQECVRHNLFHSQLNAFELLGVEPGDPSVKPDGVARPCIAGVAQRESAGSFTEAHDATGQPGARVERSGEDDGRTGKPREPGSQVTVVLLSLFRLRCITPNVFVIDKANSKGMESAFQSLQAL
jgi:hypothetical protein